MRNVSETLFLLRDRMPCLGVLLPILLAGQIPSTAHGSDFEPFFVFSALFDAKAFVTDEEISTFDSGMGKVRYGGSDGNNHRERLRIGEIAGIGFAQVAPAFSGFVHLQYNPDQDDEIDIVEGAVRYRPASRSRFRYTLRGGAFLPTPSNENLGVAWSNLYTITNSAANTWIAEEVRPVGVDAELEYRGDAYNLTVGGTMFFANDRSGTALALRGFVLNDQKVGLFGESRTVVGERVDNRPFVEVDGRPGFAVHAEVIDDTLGELVFFASDNRGDVEEEGEHGRAWATRYLTISVAPYLPYDVIANTTLMVGDTFTLPTGKGNVKLGTSFLTVSGLFAKEFGPFQLALRGEYFDQNELEDCDCRQLSERGIAVTAAATYRFGKFHRLTAEYLLVDSGRSGGNATAPLSQTENLYQLSYRFIF